MCNDNFISANNSVRFYRLQIIVNIPQGVLVDYVKSPVSSCLLGDSKCDSSVMNLTSSRARQSCEPGKLLLDELLTLFFIITLSSKLCSSSELILKSFQPQI